MYAIVCRRYGGRTLLFRSWPAESSVDNSSDSMLCTYQTSACTVLYIRMLYCIYEAVHTFYPFFFFFLPIWWLLLRHINCFCLRFLLFFHLNRGAHNYGEQCNK